jgi:hypothetical protein
MAWNILAMCTLSWQQLKDTQDELQKAPITVMYLRFPTTLVQLQENKWQTLNCKWILKCPWLIL